VGDVEGFTRILGCRVFFVFAGEVLGFAIGFDKKSTLSNLPTYYLSLFPIPVGVANRLEKL
jgi:hypothetical protein